MWLLVPCHGVYHRDKRTQDLDRLVRLLKAGKSAARIRTVNRIPAEKKERCEAGEYKNQTEAEGAFTKFVEDKPVCQKASRSKTNRSEAD